VSFEHPGWWLFAFRIGTPAMAAALVASTGICLYFTPVLGLIIAAVSVGCVVPLWNTDRHVGHRIDISDNGLSFMPYFGRARRIRWDEVTTIRQFKVLGWTARRHIVMLEGGSDWVTFAHDLERFDELRELVRDRSTVAATEGAPPWWERLLRLGTV
jgi:hypothetical protein